MIINILIADDHAIMREGLKQILAACADMRVGGEASDGDEVLRKVRQQEWSVVVLDMSMPGRSGIDLIKLVKAEKPELPILVLSMHTDEQYAARTLRAGASGYLCKDSAPSLLVSAIRKVASGGTFISPKAAESMALGALHKIGAAPPHTLLSDREFQIFELIIAGDNITEIANRLNISVKTVSTHKTRIMQKLNLDTVADMVHYAIEHGIAKQH
jgi:two-component system, NarL family, invasion response regulator UvrY